MTNELNNLVPTQEKLEWVTPKISLMDAGDTDGIKNKKGNETDPHRIPPSNFGPS